MAPLHNPKSETPLAATGGASCDSFAGLSHLASSLTLQRAQFLMMAHAIRPEMAAMLATIVFDGGAQ
jgi:hypothetical protein